VPLQPVSEVNALKLTVIKLRAEPLLRSFSQPEPTIETFIMITDFNI